MFYRVAHPSVEQAKALVLNAEDKTWIAVDTETTGLHLKKDVPFLMTITFDKTTLAIDPNLPGIQSLLDTFHQFRFVVGHNIKFDLHMLANIGLHYTGSNLTDTMILARLGLNTDDTMTIRLKVLAAMYLGEIFANDEKEVKSALTALKRDQTYALKEYLQTLGINKSDYDRMTSDTLFENTDIPGLQEFFDTHTEPNYLDIYRHPDMKEVMESYAMNDTEITLMLARRLFDVMEKRAQYPIFKLENELILPLFDMERVGLNIDREYLTERKGYMKQYIIGKRKRLKELMGKEVTVGQHKKIRDIFLEKWNIDLPSSDDNALQLVKSPEEAVNAANLIRDLRTLEKWYSTYIIRMLEKSEFDGRAYTQINANSAITGRLSSDFQQFPKNAILEDSGIELFHPRKMVIVSGKGYNKIAYLDYSQVELRVQANYTYLISGGDLNMCRAYMPHKCKDSESHFFDPKINKNDIFSREWFKEEDGVKWVPTDLHSATTHQAFPDLDPSSTEFKKMRSLGKATNFAKNYGATKEALIEQFGFEDHVADALDRGYYQAFPKILDYQNLVRKMYYQRGYVQNMYGRRYYMNDKRFVYRLYNYLVQGTCADMLKLKMTAVVDFLKPFKSRFQMNIHDEMSFEIYDGEEHLIAKLKQIMEDTPNLVVPIVAEIEVTRTNWAEKKGEH